MNPRTKGHAAPRLSAHDLLREFAFGSRLYGAASIYIEKDRVTIRLGDHFNRGTLENLEGRDNLDLDSFIWSIYRGLVRMRFAPPEPAPTPPPPELPPPPPVPPVPRLYRRQKERWEGLFGSKPRLSNGKLDTLLANSGGELTRAAPDLLADLMLARRQLLEFQRMLQEALTREAEGGDPATSPEEDRSPPAPTHTAEERQQLIDDERRRRNGKRGRKPATDEAWYQAALRHRLTVDAGPT